MESRVYLGAMGKVKQVCHDFLRERNTKIDNQFNQFKGSSVLNNSCCATTGLQISLQNGSQDEFMIIRLTTAVSESPNVSLYPSTLCRWGCSLNAFFRGFQQMLMVTTVPKQGCFYRNRTHTVYSHQCICSHCWSPRKPWPPHSFCWGEEAASPGGNRAEEKSTAQGIFSKPASSQSDKECDTMCMCVCVYTWWILATHILHNVFFQVLHRLLLQSTLWCETRVCI